MLIQSERPTPTHRMPTVGPAVDASCGQVLDRYRLVAHLETGGTADVWRAHDDLLDRDVAVKLLHAHLVDHPHSRERLGAEARAVARLSHPGIVRIYDIDLLGARPALILQLIDGPSLARRLDDGPLSPRQAARILAEVAAALGHAHDRGIVHRDVKPGNILLDAERHAHLVDFGIAQALAEGARRLTQTGTVAGTLRYMAPEQLAEEPVTPSTDLYALGVVLYEALTGSVPHTATGPIKLATQQATGAPQVSGMAPALAAVIAACLAPNPADRPAQARVVADALHAWLMGDSRPALALAPRSARMAWHWRARTLHVRPMAAAFAAGAAAGLLAITIASGGASPQTQAVESAATAGPDAGVVVGTPSGVIVPAANIAEPIVDDQVVEPPDGEVTSAQQPPSVQLPQQPPSADLPQQPRAAAMVADYRDDAADSGAATFGRGRGHVAHDSRGHALGNDRDHGHGIGNDRDHRATKDHESHERAGAHRAHRAHGPKKDVSALRS